MIRTFAPFRGIRYNTNNAGNIEKLIAPPYDVISQQQKEQLYSSSPHNIVHLDLGKDQPGDNDTNNRYTRAGSMFAEWEASGVLKQDSQPAFYVYDQEYSVGGSTYTRRAIFTSMRLEPFGDRVLPHEETMAGPRADRLKLLQACPVNLSPIFGLYPDPDNSVANAIASALPSQPDASFTDFAGIRQTFWKIDDPAAVNTISELMDARRVYIADGHHRYETALNYRNLAIENEGELDPADPRNFVMTACVSLSDPGLVVLPAHRVMGKIPGFNFDNVLKALSEYFTISPIEAPRAELPDAIISAMQGREHTFGLYADGRAVLLSLKDIAIADANPVAKSIAYKRLDVSLMGWLIFEKVLGITSEDLSKPERVSYVKEAVEATEIVDSGDKQIVCYLNPTRVEQLEDVAQAGDRMPPKSTYFYPKLLTGLVMRKLC